MNAVCIIGMTNSFYSRAGGVINAVNGTLGELGLPVAQLNILDYYLPYYEAGSSVENFTKLASALRDVKNIILAYNVTDASPSAVMKVFLEYLTARENRSILDGKNILNFAISETDGEKEAAEYVSRIVERSGGFELTRICVCGETLAGVLSGSFPINAVEKYAEDYYRLIKQNRIFLHSSLFTSQPEAQKVADSFMNLKNQVQSSMQNTMQSAATANQNQQGAVRDIRTTPATSQLYPAQEPRDSGNVLFDSDAFNARQQNDIEELTRLFSGKIKSDDAISNTSENMAETTRYAPSPINQDSYMRSYGDNNQPASDNISERNNSARLNNRAASPQSPQPPNSFHTATAYGAQNEHGGGFADAMTRAQSAQNEQIVPRNKTCKQMTHSLPHYFQSQLAHDTEAVFQMNISGGESFSGYLVIRNKENDFFEGTHDSPDITIISSSNVWQEVLKGKLSAQKAFMTGQLKVRGNFMLLNRFDQLYKKM